jgi:uncharacterized protein YwgA
MDAEMEDLTFFDKLVLWLLAHGEKSRATRLQKMGLIVNSIIEGKTPSSHGPHNFGGFSDEIEGAIIDLSEEGLVKSEGGIYRLTAYGKEILEQLQSSKDQESNKIKGASETITQGLRKLTDRDVTALTYVLFPELAKDSIIRKDVERRIPAVCRELNIVEFKRSELKNFLSQS